MTTRYVAALFEAMGVDRVVTLEVHNLAAFQNAFRCRTEHLGARGSLPTCSRTSSRTATSSSCHLTSEVSSVRTAIAMLLLDGWDDRSRQASSRSGEARDVVTGDLVVGDMKGRTAVLVDDMISGGTTLARAADACRRAGAVAVAAVAAHGAFVPNASQALSLAPLDRIIILDHIPPAPLDDTRREAPGARERSPVCRGDSPATTEFHWAICWIREFAWETFDSLPSVTGSTSSRYCLALAAKRSGSLIVGSSRCLTAIFARRRAR